MTAGVGRSEGKRPDPETRRLLHEELRHRHDVQRGVSERLEGKAALVLGASLALVPFVAKEPVQSWWLPLATAFYAFSALAAVVVVVPRSFQELDPRKTLETVWLWDPSDAAGELANNRLRAIETNVRDQAGRVLWLRVSLGLLLLGAIMSVLHLTLGERDAGGTEPTAGAAVCAHRTGGADART